MRWCCFLLSNHPFGIVHLSHKGDSRCWKGCWDVVFLYTMSRIAQCITRMCESPGRFHVGSRPYFVVVSLTQSTWIHRRPDIMVTGKGCASAPFTHGDVMNPAINATYALLDTFLAEMASTFGGNFLHLGGDEVPTTCWLENAEVSAWMKANGFTSTNQVESYFVNRYVGWGPLCKWHWYNWI